MSQSSTALRRGPTVLWLVAVTTSMVLLAPAAEAKGSRPASAITVALSSQTLYGQRSVTVYGTVRARRGITGVRLQFRDAFTPSWTDTGTSSYNKRSGRYVVRYSSPSAGVTNLRVQAYAGSRALRTSPAVSARWVWRYADCDGGLTFRFGVGVHGTTARLEDQLLNGTGFDVLAPWYVPAATARDADRTLYMVNLYRPQRVVSAAGNFLDVGTSVTMQEPRQQWQPDYSQIPDHGFYASGEASTFCKTTRVPMQIFFIG